MAAMTISFECPQCSRYENKFIQDEAYDTMIHVYPTDGMDYSNLNEQDIVKDIRMEMESNQEGFWALLPKFVILVVLIILLYYILSLPIQVVAYFFILVIRYFRKHKTPYLRLLGIYKEMVKGTIDF